MDLCVETAIDFALAQIRVGADTIGIGDAIASQLSPGIYETLIQPREKRIVRAVQQAGARVRLHICGNITHLLPAIADMRVDILDVDHMVDMRKARAVVGKKTVLSGNLDPVSAIHQSHPQAIRKAVQAIYDAVGNPYMVNAGCEIPSGTPKENLKALCEPIPWKE
jgi:MtaA/CmuA family methyltransferase